MELVILFKRRFLALALGGMIGLLPATVMAQVSSPYEDARQNAMMSSSFPPTTTAPEGLAPQPAETPLPPEDQTACIPQPYGQAMFEGTAGKSPNAIMSPQQRVASGDRIALAVWGAIQAEEVTTVDSQGFIYIRGVGPVQVSGKTQEQLSAHIRQEIRAVFRDEVQVYAKLEQNAGTPIMVTGGIAKPGQYFGGANDNLTVWLHRAGGILPQQGSYRNIEVLRDGKILARADLYPFLQNGVTDSIQWQAGDVIVVGMPVLQVSATGDVKRCAIFEFMPPNGTGAALMRLTQPLPGATHAVITGHRDGAPYKKVYPLAVFARQHLRDGDNVRFYAAPQSKKITINVEGPTLGNRLMVVPMHTRLSDVLTYIPVNAAVSNTSSIYLRRESVARLQKAALDESLGRLLQSALTAPAQSDGEALIRAKEAELVSEFVRHAKSVKPEGRVVVMQNGALRDLPLEDGDTIVIPQTTNVVSIEGEVVLPRAMVTKPKATAEDYVMMAGGFTERALRRDFVVIKPNGDALRAENPVIEPGDRLLVLPRVDSKNVQTTKDIVQILYQVAVGAGVLLSL